MLQSTQTLNPNAHYQVPQLTPFGGVSSISMNANGNLLAAGSWDKKVRIWTVQMMGQSIQATQATETTTVAPILSTNFIPDGSGLFYAGCDNQGFYWQLGQTGTQPQQFAQHDAPIKAIQFIPEMNCVATASWDRQLRFWDMRQPTHTAQFTLPDRCYAMDIKYPAAVCGTAQNQIAIFDLSTMTQLQVEKSHVDAQIRSVSVMAEKDGYAIGTIEGRVAVCYFNQTAQKQTFAFKCHRVPQKPKSPGNTQRVYPVNSVVFHRLGTLVTAGSDGTCAFWDKTNKTRLKLFKNCSLPISAATFNSDGNIFAYSASYDWSQGMDGYKPTDANEIFLYPVQEEDVKEKHK